MPSEVNIDDFIHDLFHEIWCVDQPQLDWVDLDLKEISRIRESVSNSCEIGAGCNPLEHIDREIHQLVALIILESFGARPATNWVYLPIPSLLISCYSRVVDEYFEVLVRQSTSSLKSQVPFRQRAKNFILSASCTADHEIFRVAESNMSAKELSQLLWDENLADLNFCNILVPLLYSIDSSYGIEIASNFFDEIGGLKLSKFHSEKRKVLMAAAGLPSLQANWTIDSYPLAAIFHFNLYGLNGINRVNFTRLVGMLYATEYLVPNQLGAIVRGWQRVGVASPELDYLLEHAEGDIVHAQGWEDKVIAPLIEAEPQLQDQIMMGIQQHIWTMDFLYQHQLELVQR